MQKFVKTTIMAATTVNTANAPLSSLLKRLEDNIVVVIQQIKDGERKADRPASFNREMYWTSVDAIFKMLSKETTKISLAFSKRPFPSEKNTEAMIVELEQRILTLVSLYYSLPVSEGTTLLSHYQKAVLQVLDSLVGFVTSLAQCIGSDRHVDRLQWTGGVWDASSFVLLKDNKTCTQKCLADTAELVEDALGEINEARETDGCIEDFTLDDDRLHGDAPVWSDQDRAVVTSCEGMVKTTKALLKKTRESVAKQGNIESEKGVTTLDDLVSVTSSLSGAVDDFICCIYAPINHAALLQNGKQLSDVMSKCLQFLRDSELTSNPDSKWLDFLTQALTHNLEKLEERTQSGG